MYYKIASLTLNNAQKANSIADVFIAQPDAAKETLVGKLFILGEIESNKGEATKILDFLVNNINFNYYQNEKVILKERIETISIESIFESALAKTNKDLLEFLTREKIKISPYAFNLTVCVLCQNELYFSGVGKNKNLLIYKEKAAPRPARGRSTDEEKIEYKITDIGEVKEDNEAVTLNKLFSEVLAGKIPTNGYFIIVNEALSEYLSSKQLVDIITKLSPSGAVEQLRNLLEKINSYVSFLGVIVKNTTGINMSNEELKKKIENEIKNWDYKPEIVSTEEKTEAILTSAGTVNLKKILKFLTNKLKSKTKNPSQSPTPLGSRAGKIFLLKDKIFVKKRIAFFAPEKLISLLKHLGVFLIKAFHGLMKKSKKEKPDVGGLSLADDKEKISNPFFSGKKAKIFLFIGAIFIIVMISNIFITRDRQEKAEKLRAFNSVLADIDKNQNKIDAFLLYGNENEAKDLWGQNEKLLSSLSQEDKANRQDIKNFIEKQTGLLEKLRRVTIVSDLKKIADFSNLNQAAVPENIILSADKLYAADSTTKAVYKIDLKENLVTATYNLGDTTEMKYPSADDQGLVYLDRNSVLSVNKTDNIQKTEIENVPENIGGIGIYNNRLYLADKNNGQIRRYSKVGEKYSTPENWLNTATNFSSVTKLFIDGNIYVLMKNGQIEKYLKGKKEDFSIAALDEPIDDASNMIIGEKHVYVFEANKKRLIIFDEAGKFQSQYIFSSLEKTTDFSASEKDNKIYILSGSSVYETTVK
jgi:hypothetical protein